jgi:glycosyltransferase involved in cell wall biosynthesis
VATGSPVDRPRLVFVLPALDLAGDEHFAHSVDLARAVMESSRVRSSVLVLRPPLRPWPAHDTVTVQYLPSVRPARAMRFAGYLLRLGPRDVVFVRISTQALSIALALSRLRGFRVVFWHSTWQPGLSGGGARKDRRLSFLLPAVDALISYPEIVAEYYRTTYGLVTSKVKVVPNNVSLDHMMHRAWPTDASIDRLLYVGRLSARKGSQDLPRIARELQRQGLSSARIVVAGHGPLLPSLEGDPGLVLLGAVPNTEVLSLMKQAHVLLMPSYAEGCSRVLQEACALGLPVALYDIPPSRSLLGNLAQDLCVRLGNSSGLASKARELRSLPSDRREKLEERMRGQSFQWKSSTVADQLLQALAL